MSSLSSVILADQVSPLPCFYNNSTQTGKLTITVHSWSLVVGQSNNYHHPLGGSSYGGVFQQEISQENDGGVLGRLCLQLDIQGVPIKTSP